MDWRTLTTAGAAMAAIVLASPARAHEGGGDGAHLLVGYYYGDIDHDLPADPPWPPTLLVDTHPWELDGEFWDLTPVTDGLLTGGYLSELPGFDTLPIDGQEFDGHGYFSWLDPGYTHGAVNVQLQVLSLDAGLSILNPDTLEAMTGPFTLGSDFHGHFNYYVDAGSDPLAGKVYGATFKLVDLNGNLAESVDFTVQFRIVPEPGTLVLGCALVGVVLMRRHSFHGFQG